MNCPICDGNLENKLVNICACDELPPVVVRGVPALVCERCEEKVLTQESIDVIATVRGGGAPPPIIAQYSLYDYQNLKTGIPLNFYVITTYWPDTQPEKWSDNTYTTRSY